jgi:hypothetical protein
LDPTNVGTTSILEMPQTSIPDILLSIMPSFITEFATFNHVGIVFFLILHRTGILTLKTL